jgi:hypothetical protein
MKNMLHIRRASFALLAALTIGCSDRSSPVAPSETPVLEIVDPAVVADALHRNKPLRTWEWAAATIGPEGGELTIPAAGLKLKVPAGAVAEPIQFTAVAIPGDIVAYVFGPHGTTFARPLTVKQSLRETELFRAKHIPRNLEAGYFADWRQIDLLNDQVLVNEFLPARLDQHGANITWEVEHFSGYMLSTGRKMSAGY